jgi:hypothetical protein
MTRKLEICGSTFLGGFCLGGPSPSPLSKPLLGLARLIVFVAPNSTKDLRFASGLFFLLDEIRFRSLAAPAIAI